MIKNLKFLLVALVCASFFSWGINLLGEKLDYIMYWREYTRAPKLVTAQANLEALEAKLRSSKPVRNKEVEDLEIDAKSAISVFLDNRGNERILFEKNAYQKLPIASLTKLMTAYIVLENYDLSKEIKISKEAVAQEEDFGKLEVGKILPVKYLLYPLLIESSNDATYALVNDYNGMEEKKFVALMNLEAGKLGLRNTYFINTTGLDPEESEREMNYSTAIDLTILTKNLLKKSLIWEILSTPKFDPYGPVLVNTNELLGKISGVVGGKTGYTERASGCFLLVLEAPKGMGYLINVILGSQDRFDEMEKLLDWVREAHKW